MPVIRTICLKEERSIKSSLLHVKSQSYVSQRKVKALESELKPVEERKDCPLFVIDVLEDQVIESACPNIRRLVILLVLIPHSEAVVERVFSKMKLTMNERRTSLDKASLKALLKISHNSTVLMSIDINHITDI